MYVALLLAAAVVPAPPEMPATERWSWSMATDGEVPVTVLRVHNDYGDVRARKAGAALVEGWGVVQRLGSEPGAVGVSVERRGGIVTLTVGYPPGRVQEEPALAKDAMDRLDLAVFVPPGVRFEAITSRGMVEGRGLQSDVDARTADGAITVMTTGSVVARSGGGEITVVLQPGATPSTPVLLQSESGSIAFAHPSALALAVTAETAGAIAADPPFTTSEVDGRRRARVDAPAGAVPVVVHSRRGDVRLERTPE